MAKGQLSRTILGLFLMALLSPLEGYAQSQPAAKVAVEQRLVAAENSDSNIDSCSAMLSLSPVSEGAKWRRLLMPIGEVFGAQSFLPPGCLVSIGPKSDADFRAIEKSLENGKKEVHFVRVLDSNGTARFETEFHVGKVTEVDVYVPIVQTIKYLRALKLENEILTIEDTHTHPWIPGRSLISVGDVKATLMFRALLELSGFKRTTLKSSILYMKFSQMDYEKKTVTIEPTAISYFNGDYSLGTTLDDLLRRIPTEQIKNIVDILEE